MIYENLETVSDLAERNEILKNKKLRFCWYLQIKIHYVQVFIFMKQQLFFYNSLKF